MSNPETVTATANDPQKPSVIIVGAGLGGLLLGALLQNLGHPFHIFERATVVRPLGSAIAIGASILPIFQQLGLLEEIKKSSLPVFSLDIYTANIELYSSLKLPGKEGTEYDDIIIERPKLYDILLSQVLPQNISFSKKVLRTEENEDKVYVRCSDNTTYSADILVGADGAYSGVRQSLYKRMNEKGLLPSKDLEDFSVANVCMVGISEPTDKNRYPQIQDHHAVFSSTLGNDNKTYVLVNTPGNRVCWSLIIQLSNVEARQQQFRNSEWGPEANEAMIKVFQDMPSPWGGTLSEIIQDTPKDLISKVFLEEKIFTTWHHGRIVLIGDVLANAIYNMHDLKQKTITAAFEDYYRQRYQRAADACKVSSTWTRISYGQSWSERLLRHITLKYMPYSLYNRAYVNARAYRPQIAWLPLVKVPAGVNVLPQECKRGEVDDEKRANAI
ncbi:hypothetical protein EDD11_008904 [Mortierella claussenii]|nr:hypothetical protein EDD11_008904 [Mortierella claussenii]